MLEKNGKYKRLCNSFHRNERAYLLRDDVMVENLETYSLIWLDNAVNQSFENVQAQQTLRMLIHHLLTFDDVELCLDYIDHRSSNDRVLLIVNGRLGQIIVPQVALLRQIVSIYVYCIDKQMNEKWTRNFTKVNLITKISYTMRIF